MSKRKILIPQMTLSASRGDVKNWNWITPSCRKPLKYKKRPKRRLPGLEQPRDESGDLRVIYESLLSAAESLEKDEYFPIRLLLTPEAFSAA